MAKKRPKYDSTMYFDNSVVGKGTKADGDQYSVLLEACNGNPHEVLKRYKYFSPNVEQALKSACKLYDK